MKQVFGILLMFLCLSGQGSDLFLEGRLLDTAGQPIAKTTFTADVYLYAAATGTAGQQKIDSVAADRLFTDADGYYAFHIRNIDLSNFMKQHSEAWLALENVNNTITQEKVSDLRPRQRIGSVPYALIANHASRLADETMLNADGEAGYSLTVTNNLIASYLPINSDKEGYALSGDVNYLDFGNGVCTLLGSPVTGKKPYRHTVGNGGKARSFYFRESAGYDGFENGFDYIWRITGDQLNAAYGRGSSITKDFTVNQDCLVRLSYVMVGVHFSKSTVVTVYSDAVYPGSTTKIKLFDVFASENGPYVPDNPSEPPNGPGYMLVFPMRAGYTCKISCTPRLSSYEPYATRDDIPINALWVGAEIIPFGARKVK